MRKIAMFSLIAIFSMVIGFNVSAKQFITGYDVNNNYAPVRVEVGVYVRGVSLYPKSLGITTQSNLSTTGTLTVGGCVTQNGLTTCVSSGTLADATTTILAVANPFTASSTIDLGRITITGVATSTYTFTCGKSATAYAATDWDLISSGSIATSTNPGVISNNVSGSYGASVTGGSVAKIMVGPNQYLVCKVSSAYTGAFTEKTNTFAGTYKFRWIK